MKQLIAKRYVKALLSALDEKGIEVAANKLSVIAEAFNDKKFLEIIVSPEVKRDKREALILDIIGKDSDKKLVNFIKTLSIHNRFSLIPEIATLLQKELQRRANRYEGIVESMQEVDQTDLKELESALSKYVDATIVLQPVKSNYNGIKVVVEDLGIEATYSKDRIASDMINHILKAL
jgi:F-type H+-transporting ATPase subunit delta